MAFQVFGLGQGKALKKKSYITASYKMNIWAPFIVQFTYFSIKLSPVTMQSVQAATHLGSFILKIPLISNTEATASETYKWKKKSWDSHIKITSFHFLVFCYITLPLGWKLVYPLDLFCHSQVKESPLVTVKARSIISIIECVQSQVINFKLELMLNLTSPAGTQLPGCWRVPGGQGSPSRFFMPDDGPTSLPLQPLACQSESPQGEGKEAGVLESSCSAGTGLRGITLPGPVDG